MARKYPDRWLDYSKFGSQVEGTSFIPLKVPLNKKFFTKREEDSFTPEDAIEQIPNLGLVIDLTFTSKYYNPSEFLQQNVKHKKIFTKGHEVPKRSLVNVFIRTVNDFLAEEQNKDKLIGVHCTHGLNRTGYFVCAYMILVQGQAPKSAINLFNEARAHPMERENYLNALHQFIPLSHDSTEPREADHEGSRDHFQNNHHNRYNGYNRSNHHDRGLYEPNSWRRDRPRDDNRRFNRDRPYDNPRNGSGSWRSNYSRGDCPRNGYGGGGYQGNPDRFRYRRNEAQPPSSRDALESRFAAIHSFSDRTDANGPSRGRERDNGDL